MLVQLPVDGSCHTDPLLLERILRNLLDNAIKYTDCGSIELSARARSAGFEIGVWDTGPGIALAEQEQVFEEFYQLNNPQRDRSEGLGLGLSIVRRLSDLLKLSITMTSIVGIGTAFTLQIVAGVADDKTVDQPLLAPPSIKGLKVLVIDDEAAVREGMRTLLEALGGEVQVACGTQEAQALATTTQPDVVLADFRLHGSDDGLAAVRSLRFIYPGLAALLVSGDTAPQRLRDAHAAGLPLLHKPTSAQVLAHAIRTEVDRMRGLDYEHRIE